MQGALIILAASAATSALLTPLIRRWSKAHGLYDRPDNGRKNHVRAVPRLGGVALYAAFLLPLLVALFAWSCLAARVRQGPGSLVGLLAAGTLIFFMGVADDLRGMSPWAKLFVQVLAALIAFGCGYRITLITNPFGAPFSLGLSSLPVTLLWIIGITNALNLIDGLDGVASGVMVFAGGATLVCAMAIGNELVVCFLSALVGANLGFLVYNLRPASIFMGDSGSQFCGFVLALLTITGLQKSNAALSIFLPVVILGLPISDTFFSVLRRSTQGVSIFKADTGHIHHRLLRMGMSPSQVMYLYYGLCLTLGVLGLISSAVANLRSAAILVTGGVAFVIMVRVAEGIKAARQTGPRPAVDAPTPPCLSPERRDRASRAPAKSPEPPQNLRADVP